MLWATGCGPSRSGTGGGGDTPDSGSGGTCQAGQPGCPDGGGSSAGGCQTQGNDLVFVVDDSYRLLRFDPRKLGGSEDPFTLIGQLDCQAGPAYPNVGGSSTATPFSMSVDRSGNAWVLYSSGEIFKVSITDASCQATSFQKGQDGFELFGMGFVSNSAGSSDETLFIAGGAAGSQDQVGDLASVAPNNMMVSPIGGLPNAEYSPELTGTANAELYAYFPGSLNSFVARIGKTDATSQQKWDVQPLGFSSPEAWAFAHWGGKFYIFITGNNGFSSVSKVREFDPMTGNDTTVISDSQYKVVGAGVSTCAPVVVD